MTNYRLSETHKHQQGIPRRDGHVPAKRTIGHERPSIYWQLLADCVELQRCLQQGWMSPQITAEDNVNRVEPNTRINATACKHARTKEKVS